MPKIEIIRVREPLERIEYATNKLIDMLNDKKIKLKQKDLPFFTGYLFSIKATVEEMKYDKK